LLPIKLLILATKLQILKKIIMKQSILLFSAALLAGSAFGQESYKSILFQRDGLETAAPQSVSMPRVTLDRIFNNPTGSTPAGKTTGVGIGRWYNYGAYQYNLLGGDYTTGGFAGTQAPYMWFDTSSKDIYGGTPPLNTNNVLSVAEVLDPMFTGFNDPTTFAGELAVLTTNAYTIDSVDISGGYGRHIPSSATIVDTLRISLTSGSGSGTASNLGVSGWEYPASPVPWIFTQYGTDTLLYLQPYHDSAKNRLTNVNPSGTTLGAAPMVFDIYLHNTDTSGNFSKVVAVPGTGLAVAAGSFAAMSLTFISGDATAPHMPPGSLHFGDTVFTGDAGNPYRYGMFRPTIVYKSDASGNPQWMSYATMIGTTTASFKATKDLNLGLFKTEPAPSWGGAYLPNWAYHAGTAAAPTPSSYQWPAWGGMHVKCPTCIWTNSLGVTEIKSSVSVNVYPNPANNELNFSITSRAEVAVTLSNMLGQTVASQTTTSGQAVINTSLIPAGVYVYSIVVNGERTTGRVVIAH